MPKSKHPAASTDLPYRWISSHKMPEYTDLSVSFWEKLRQKQAGPPYRKLGRAVLYRTDEVDAWLDAESSRQRELRRGLLSPIERRRREIAEEQMKLAARQRILSTQLAEIYKALSPPEVPAGALDDTEPGGT